MLTAEMIVLFTSAVLALIGVGSIFFGGVVIGITPTTVQEGATTQWTPSPGITGATVTAATTF